MIKDGGRLPRRVEYGRAAQGEALWAKVSTQLLYSWTNYLQEALNEDENTVAEAFNDKNKKALKQIWQSKQLFCLFYCTFLVPLSSMKGHITSTVHLSRQDTAAILRCLNSFEKDLQSSHRKTSNHNNNNIHENIVFPHIITFSTSGEEMAQLDS